MAALTADKARPASGTPYGFPADVAASTTIFLGSLCAFNAAGFLVPATDTAAIAIAGIAQSGCDNSAGANGGESIIVQRGSIREIAHSGLVQADCGKNVFVEDDNSVTDSAAATNDLKAGTLLGFNGSLALLHVGVFADVDA